LRHKMNICLKAYNDKKVLSVSSAELDFTILSPS
jgi:hypothetical protein